MKKIVSLILVLALCVGALTTLTACGSADYTIGICQLMKHDSLDKATEGFIKAVEEEMAKAGKTVKFDTQVPGEADLCTTVIGAFTAKNVDLIMANATPALVAAANATATIPVLGTSVTDYDDTFKSGIPSNVSGTSDGVPFDSQAQMMIDSLNLVAGDKVGVLYCSNESNSAYQYEQVKTYFESKGIVVEKYTFSETTELQAITATAADACKAIYVPSDNTVADNDSVVGTVCDEKNVPVYTSYPSTIAYATLGIDYYKLGYETGKMAADILLNGKSPADIDILKIAPEAPSYNEEICAKLGITVPEN